MSFLEGYTAATSTVTALEATRIRALVEAQGRLQYARQQQEELIAHLRNEIFQFASVLNAFLRSSPERRNWAGCVFEAQRFQNWDCLNPTAQATLPTFQDKGFLEQARQTAHQLISEASTALNADEIARIRRLAVLEDLAPFARLYQSWKKVLKAIRAWTPLLFNGIPGIGMLFLYVFLLSSVVSWPGGLLQLAAQRMPGLYLLLELLASVFFLLAFVVAATGLLGPFLRKIIAGSLNRSVAPFGGWVTSRATSSRVRAVLQGISHQMSLLDPRFLTAQSIISDEELNKVHAELSSLREGLTG
jgi:hypothetical protein